MTTRFIHLCGGLLLLSLGSLVILRLTPGRPAGAVSPVEFSSERALRHLEIIAEHPRPVGSPAHARTREYLVTALRGFGLSVEIESSRVASLIAGNLTSSEVDNVVATLRGKNAGGAAVLLAAHYDSVAESHGASDDGSGVVTLVEAARALASGPKLDNDILFLFTDAEEAGLLGAQAFAASSHERRRVAVALNFDARGSHGVVTMFDTSDDNGLLVQALGEAVIRPVASSFVSKLAQALPNDTDATIFKRAGVLTGSFAYADGLEHYHRATDSLATIDPASVDHAGAYAVGLARWFASRSLDDVRAPSVVYFDLFGAKMVSYSKTAARLLAALAIGLFAWLFGMEARAKRVRLGSIAKGAAAVLVTMFVFALVAVAVRVALAPFVPLFFLIAHAKLVVMAGLLVAAALALLGGAWLARRLEVDEAAWGAMLVLAAPLVPLAWFLPEVTAPLTWPLFGLLAVRWAAPRRETRASLAIRYAGLVPTVVILTQVTYAVLVAAGGTMPFAPAMLAGLGAALVASNFRRPARRELTVAVPCLLASGTFLAVFCCLVSRFSEREPMTDSLFYGVDTESMAPRWGTFDAELDPWVAERIPSVSPRSVLRPFTRWTLPLWNAPATPIPFQPARVTANRDGSNELSIEPRDDVRCVDVWQEAGPPVVATRVNGEAVQSVIRFSPEIDAKAMRIATGDQSHEGWHLSHCGFARGPLRVRLEKTAPGTADLRVVERRDGLPRDAGGAALSRPREPWLVPQQESDVTLVSQVVHF
ncbi:MAG TPA: M20/M25/M40 family metallo-hydrolase [Polyangiaceae bacterium]|nr:M20/M25/M40 family metallo-hydrolase [Polyangiaceae bacterium]